ncbi:MAG: 7-cyano-7-deazaguanine synthase QueC [Candidatus Latescibacteria bacterium]|nr:7-cyano-7-deazaguanine synthase QueC [bacterium]MBD3423178.1 7-cyano-7-deazaguanine synthase QueC [Candidatus Latescibacterota bacterium]
MARNRSMKKENALALLSGGLDSAVAAAMAVRRYSLVQAIFFDYGQLAAEREKSASRQIASFFGMEHRCIDLPWLGSFSGSALTGSGSDNGKLEEGGAGAVWVENRNGIFLNIAAAVAVRSGCSVVITGFNLEEAGEFPDNSREFMDAVNRALRLGEINRVRVESPTVDLSKREIVREGIELEVPWSSLWSCYRGKKLMCGRCQSCLRLKNAIRGSRADELITFEGEKV